MEKIAGKIVFIFELGFPNSCFESAVQPKKHDFLNTM